MRPRILAATIPGLAIVLGACLSGCGQNGTNAGLTNGPPPGAGEKTAERNDLPGSTSASPGIPAGELGDAGNNAGSGGSGGGNQGNPQPARSASSDSDSVRANPPVKSGGDRNSAAGGTKPPEPIQTGTPKSPQ